MALALFKALAKDNHTALNLQAAATILGWEPKSLCTILALDEPFWLDVDNNPLSQQWHSLHTTINDDSIVSFNAYP